MSLSVGRADRLRSHLTTKLKTMVLRSVGSSSTDQHIQENVSDPLRENEDLADATLFDVEFRELTALKLDLARVDSQWHQSQSLRKDLVLYDRGVVPHIHLLDSYSRHLDRSEVGRKESFSQLDGAVWQHREILTSARRTLRIALATEASTPIMSSSASRLDILVKITCRR
jgi:hypothetical protein